MYQVNEALNLNSIIDIKDWFFNNYSDISKYNKRAKIDLGKFCNASCGFCYYSEQLDSKDFLNLKNLEYIVRGLLDRGIEEVEFSGGEPTVHPKFKEIAETTFNIFKEYNLEPKISIVSNGSIKIDRFIEILPYINEWLISLHGVEKVHDEIVNFSNAFSRIREIISYYTNNNDLNFKLLRINFVVHIHNGESNLSKSARNMLLFLLRSGIQVNILPLNYWSDAKNIDTGENLLKIYNSINLFVKELIDNPKLDLTSKPKNLRSELLNIRYPQFCLLIPEAHKFARGHYDHLVDKHDWNKIYYPLDFDPAENKLKIPNENIFNLIYYKNIDFKNIDRKELFEIEKIVSFDRLVSHYKDPVCKNCNFFNNCDGIKYNDKKTNNSLKSFRKWYKESDFNLEEIDKQKTGIRFYAQKLFEGR